jgi:hydrogenase maturation factor
MQPFPTGKIPPEALEKLLRRMPRGDPRVLIGPQVGEDAAVIDLGDRYLVVTTDPITFATDRIGWYLVHINANDLACMGARPRWLLVTCLLPERQTDERMVEALFDDIAAVCGELGITVCGGHTEITVGLDRPILVGQLLGEVAKENFVDKRRIRPGDLLLLTKGIAIEGTSVIARDREGLLRRSLPEACMERAKGFLTDPGISILKEAEIACRTGGGYVHGMHDPTEGGLSQALWELACCARVGVRIEGERIPVFPETRLVCERLGLNPMGLLASGALLLAVDPQGAPRIEEAILQAAIPCTRIGEVCEQRQGLQWVSREGVEPMPRFERDEMVKVFQEISG